MEVRRSEPGVPVVAMQDVGAPERVELPEGEVCRRPAEGSEAPVVVAPFGAVRSEVGIAGAIEEPGCVQHVGNQVAAGHLAAADDELSRAECRTDAGNRLQADEAVPDGRDAGQHQADVEPLVGEGRR